MVDENEIPSSAQFLADVIEGRATGKYTSVTKTMTARLPVLQVALIESMAAASGKSRTFILSELIEAGSEQVLAHMSKAALKKIRQEQGRRAKEILADADATTETE